MDTAARSRPGFAHGRRGRRQVGRTQRVGRRRRLPPRSHRRGPLFGTQPAGPASLLLLKETLSLLLGLGHLLAQDLVLFVLDLSEIQCLLFDHLLADVLLLLEALGLAVLLHLVDVLFLFGILILDALVLLLPALDFLLICFQVLVG
jgi:hypothetical protein